MNELMIFNNPEFGEVRTIEEDGKVLFCGKDVASALGYKRPADAITAHCKGSVICRLPTNGGEQAVKFIPEDELVDRALNTGIRETAKELGVKEKDFVKFLLDKRYLYRDKKGKLQSYAQYADDLFVLKECFNEKTQWAGTQLLVTPKGRETFRLLFVGAA